MISSPGWAGRSCIANAPGAARVEQRVVDAVGGQRAAALGRGRPRRPCSPTRRCRPRARPAPPRSGSAWSVNRPLAPRRQREALLERVARAARRPPRRSPASVPSTRERARDVVAVADVGDPQPVERAVGLAQRQQVGERLAGVVARGEHVDDRHRAVRARAPRASRRGPCARRPPRRGARARARCRAAPRRARAAARPSAAPAGGRRARAMPTSKDTRVRVEGFSKISATLRPASAVGATAARA